MDALKNFMPTMTDTIMQQLSEQVKKAMEATSSTRPLLTSITCLPRVVSPPIGTLPCCHIATTME